MQLLKANLQSLRRDVNTATVALAASQMSNEDAAGALMWTLHSTASEAYAMLQEEYDRQDEEGIAPNTRDMIDAMDEEQQGICVQTLNLQETIPQRTNPLVFALPFVIAPRDFTSLSDAGECLASISAVALFNLGLARHTQSFISKPEDETSLLEEAKELYLQGLDLLDHLKSLTPDGPLILTYLGLCNNLVEVYSKLGDSTEASNWQVTLRQCLWTVPPAKNSRVYRHFLNASQTYDIQVLPLAPMNMD